jgi:hypothetical protein
MTSRRVRRERVHLPRDQAHITGKQEGTMPKRLKRERLAEVIPLPGDTVDDQPPIHGNCTGCQVCICARLERKHGGTWRLSTEGVPERMPE